MQPGFDPVKDLPLAISALTQEISTLLRHLDPRRNSRRGPVPADLKFRLRTLRKLHRKLSRKLHSNRPATQLTQL